MSTKNQPKTITIGAQPSASEPGTPEGTKASCCGGSAVAAPTDREQDDVAECPVMTGTPVNKAQAEAAGLFRDYNGQRYWFCCAGCGPIWDADPEEYAAA